MFVLVFFHEKIKLVNVNKPSKKTWFVEMNIILAITIVGYKNATTRNTTRGPDMQKCCCSSFVIVLCCSLHGTESST